MSARWLDLLDPTREEILTALPGGVDNVAELLVAAPRDGVRIRPQLERWRRWI